MRTYKQQGITAWYCTCVIQDPEKQPEGVFVCTYCEKEVVFEPDTEDEN